jgi:hypothetical protein
MDTAQAMPAPARRRPPWPWVVFALVVVVIAGGAITAAAVSLRYAHAAPLTCACGLVWGPPDNRVEREVGFVQQELVVPPRPGEKQSFYVEITNRSDVTQTVLGLPPTGGPVAEPDTLTISREPTEGPGSNGLGDFGAHYVRGPVAIAPGQVRTLRYTIHTYRCWQPSRSEYWTSLDVRVRVGMFTRTETIDFDNSAFVLHSYHRMCG